MLMPVPTAGTRLRLKLNKPVNFWGYELIFGDLQHKFTHIKHMAKEREEKGLLTDIWYLAMPGHILKRGKTISKIILNRNMVFGRDEDGNIFCLKDLCPHRGVPLSYGAFDGREIECCYHGWCFNRDGACTKIPSLGEDTEYNMQKIKVFRYEVKEINGNIWVYIPPAYRFNYEVTRNSIADFPMSEDKKFKYVSTHLLECDLDNAVIGLIDPAHVPNVHASWWWRSKKTQKKKQKKFLPSKLGFIMASHKPASNSRVYSLFKKISVEITFSIPGIRVEHIRYGEKREIILLTALTPLTDNTTELNQFLYTNVPLVKILFPLLQPIGKVFINQDVKIIKKQKEGLKYNPPLMLVGEADQQARWYHQLKENYTKSTSRKEALVHPLKEETVLTWYS